MSEDTPVDRLIREVRNFGLDAATEVANRFTQLAGQEVHELGGRWLDSSWTDWEGLVQSFGRYPNLGEAAPSQQTDQLTTPPTGPGGTTTVKLWLHNTAPEPLTVDSVRVSELQSRAGDQLVDCWHLDRTPPFSLPPGANAAITITVRVPGTTPPGLFTGLVFVAPHGIAPIPMVIEVEAEVGPGSSRSP